MRWLLDNGESDSTLPRNLSADIKIVSYAET